MKAFMIVNDGLASIASREIKELINFDAQVNGNIINFNVEEIKDLLKLVYHSQSAKRIILSLGQYQDLSNLKLETSNFSWQDFFHSDLSFKVEVLNVKGNENRIAISKKIAAQLFDLLETKDIFPDLELRKPQQLIVVYQQEGTYHLGLDFTGVELNSRDYRVFTSPASFKGDLAYYFIRNSEFKKENKVVIGWVKDGTLAIEAALFANQKIIQTKKYFKFSFSKFPILKNFDFAELFNEKFATCKIFAFDESMTNFTAAKKNTKLAGVSDAVVISRHSLDELDVKYSEKELDQLIFQITSKDEDKINEIYYQAGYVLKSGGTLFLITRENFSLPISNKFDLLKTEELQRGDSKIKFWLLRRK